MRCKRHISFGFTEVMLVLLTLCFALSSILSNEPVTIFVKYILPLVLSVLCMNLVRSTSILESCYKILFKLISLFSFIILALYVLIIVFGYNRVMSIAGSNIFSSFISTITSKDFSPAFIIIAVPLVFAKLISTYLPYHLFTLTILLLYSSVFCSFAEITVIVLSCFAILCFYNMKSIFLAILSPAIAYLLTLPKNYLTGLLQLRMPKVSETFVLDKFFADFKSNLLFGKGFLSEKLLSSGIGDLILSCGIIGTTVFLVLVLKIIFKNIKFTLQFDLSKTTIKSSSAGLCVASLFFIIMSILTSTFSDLRCICLFAIIISLTRNVQRCIDADFIDKYSVREYEI